MPGRIYIRFAGGPDAERLVREGILFGPAPAGQSWFERARLWLGEQQAGRRLILIAEDNKGIIGTAQIVFRLPQGFNDPEAANGTDIAMLEMLRTRQGASPQVAERLIQEIENIALKRNFKALTFCISTEQPRAIAQVKAWGFQEFRLMPEKRGMLAFFRKILQPGFDPSPPKPQPPEPKKPPPPPPPEPQGPDEV